MTLSYGAFEAVLYKHIKTKMTKQELANLLLLSPLIDAQKPKDRILLREEHLLAKETLTRIRAGERGIPGHLMKHYASSDALEYIKLCFIVDIAPHLWDNAEETLTQEILDLVRT